MSVIIVGGGIAGCATALSLVRSNPTASFLLVDDAEPGSFKIGESLPAEAKRLLQYLSPSLPGQIAEDTAKGTHKLCTGNASVWESPELHETFSIMNPFGSGWHLDRAVFDESLRAQVRAICSNGETQRSRLMKGKFAGVSKDSSGWCLSCEDLESKEAREFHCSWLVDASGRKASVAHKIGAKTVKLDGMLAFYALMSTTNADLDHRTLIEATENGWWYSSQLADNRRIVAFQTDDQDPASKRARKSEGFLDMLRDTVHLSQLVEETDYRIISGAGYPRCTAAGSSYLQPFGNEVDQWCAVGDAAVAFDPLSSQGMITALRLGGSLGIVLARKLQHLDEPADPSNSSSLEIVQTQCDDCRKDYEKKRGYQSALNTYHHFETSALAGLSLMAINSLWEKFRRDDKAKTLIDEICVWATARLNDGRWSSIKHGLSISKEIDEFKTRIADARALFVDLSIIENSKGMDAILNEIERVQHLQKDQLQGIQDKLDAQEQARARDQFLAQVLVTVSNPTYNHQGKSPCDEGTRAEILAEIKNWIKDGSSKSQGFLWLSGDPGSGKSAIMASIARDCKNDGTLWAQFFINRNSWDTTDPNLYFPSIARQFMEHSLHPDVATTIHEAIKERPTLVDEISSAQASKLFVDVLEVACQADSSKPVVVVIDGLDETNRSQLATTAEIFSRIFKSLLSHNAKVLISSRTDDDIRRPFASMMDAEHVKHIHLDTSAPASIRDVSVYLARRISYIVERHDLNWAHWPGQSRMKLLCDRASGLFIWAVTVVKFFQDQINVMGMECLNDLLDTFSHEGMGDINTLYGVILQLAYNKSNDPWVHQTFRRVVGCIIAAQEPLSIAKITSLLALRRNPTSSPVDIIRFCRRLRTVLISGADEIDSETIPRLHKSFFEFITSSRAEIKFRVDLRYSNSELALKSIQMLTALAQQHSLDRVPYDTPGELRYAMQFWEPHLRAAANYGHGLCVVSNDPRPSKDNLEKLRGVTYGTRRNPFGVLISSKRTALSSGRELWGRRQRQPPVLFSPPIAATAECSALAFSSDRKTAAFSVAHSISIWDIHTGRTISSCEGHTATVKALAFSQDGKFLASGGDDRTLRVWNTQSGAPHSTSPNSYSITSVAFTLDGKQVVFYDQAATMHFFDLAASQTIRSTTHPTVLRHSIALSPDCKFLVSVGEQTVYVWDLETGGKLYELRLDNRTESWALAVFSPLGRHFACFDGAMISLWDVETGELVRKFKHTEELSRPTARIMCAAFSPDGKYFVGGGYFDGVCIWNVHTGGFVDELFEDSGVRVGDVAYAVAFTADGKHIMKGGSYGVVRMWDLPTLESATSTGNISSTVLSSSAILSASFNNNIIRYWDIDTFLPTGISIVGGNSKGFSILAISPDETRIAALSTTNLVSLWDASTHQLVCPPMTPIFQGVSPSLSLMFSSDNMRLTLASLSQAFCSWSPADGSRLRIASQITEEEPTGERFDLEHGWSDIEDSDSCPHMRFLPFHAEAGLWAYLDKTLIRSNGPGSLTIQPNLSLNLGSSTNVL
ncbi:hypothetical protein HWV62_11143 [Athelia sp. TMB]|nr:hypothetical protein HWV62_11143 [Athelia sp. TMB]